MKPTAESSGEESLKDKLKSASNLIKKISDNQFTAKKLPRGTSQPDMLADLGAERYRVICIGNYELETSSKFNMPKKSLKQNQSTLNLSETAEKPPLQRRASSKPQVA